MSGDGDGDGNDICKCDMCPLNDDQVLPSTANGPSLTPRTLQHRGGSQTISALFIHLIRSG